MYDVVLMDIQMPVMDGMTATKLIRSTFPEPAKNVKIIAMTANVLQEDVQQYLDAGMDAFVSKPFQINELLLKIDSVVDNSCQINSRVNDNSKSKDIISSEPPLPEKVTDMKFLKQFTGNNNDKMHKYIGMFLDNAPRQLQTIDTAIASGDYNTIKLTAHSLKPQLAYMGVKEEYSNILLIEQTAGEKGQHVRLPELIKTLKLICIKAFDELKTNK
jgi:response regulator RpfG family c-di-GMP phosphodiesterase